jgi:hypothetical protein
MSPASQRFGCSEAAEYNATNPDGAALDKQIAILFTGSYRRGL